MRLDKQEIRNDTNEILHNHTLILAESQCLMFIFAVVGKDCLKS